MGRSDPETKADQGPSQTWGAPGVRGSQRDRVTQPSFLNQGFLQYGILLSLGGQRILPTQRSLKLELLGGHEVLQGDMKPKRDTKLRVADKHPLREEEEWSEEEWSMTAARQSVLQIAPERLQTIGLISDSVPSPLQSRGYPDCHVADLAAHIVRRPAMETCLGSEECRVIAMETCLGSEECKAIAMETCLGSEECKAITMETCLGSEECKTITMETCLGSEECKAIAMETCLGSEECKAITMETCLGSEECKTIAMETCLGSEECKAIAMETCLGSEECKAIAMETCLGSEECKVIANARVCPSEHPPLCEEACPPISLEQLDRPTSELERCSLTTRKRPERVVGRYLGGPVGCPWDDTKAAGVAALSQRGFLHPQKTSFVLEGELVVEEELLPLGSAEMAALSYGVGWPLADALWMKLMGTEAEVMAGCPWAVTSGHVGIGQGRFLFALRKSQSAPLTSKKTNLSLYSQIDY